MKTKFKARVGRYLDSTITPVEIERETDKSVWVNGNRNAKQSDWATYFDTWEEAYSALLEAADKKVVSARLALDKAKGFYGNVNGLRKPK
jgi:hypothetical protein